MKKLTTKLDGTVLGRSALSMPIQDYLSELETDVTRMEAQLWRLMELRPEAKARYCMQWRDTVRMLETEAFKKTGLQVEIHTPPWVSLSEQQLEHAPERPAAVPAP